ncbi:hypothetical protein BJX65DRAFT_280655 [Aspergillus insuetus]
MKTYPFYPKWAPVYSCSFISDCLLILVCSFSTIALESTQSPALLFRSPSNLCCNIFVW